MSTATGIANEIDRLRAKLADLAPEDDQLWAIIESDGKGNRTRVLLATSRNWTWREAPLDVDLTKATVCVAIAMSGALAKFHGGHFNHRPPWEGPP